MPDRKLNPQCRPNPGRSSLKMALKMKKKELVKSKQGQAKKGSQKREIWENHLTSLAEDQCRSQNMIDELMNWLIIGSRARIRGGLYEVMGSS